MNASVAFGAGSREQLGATPHADGSTSFVVWAPHADCVTICVCPEGNTPRRVPLEPGRGGYHGAHVPGVGAGARYAFSLDGADPVPDPASASQPDGVHGTSEVVDHAAFAWSDQAWHGIPLRDYVIYELHVGAFTPEGTFDAAAARLPELAADGITAVELMPVAEFPGGRNWGYDGVDLCAPQSTYGGPDGFKRFVDAAHAAGVAVVLDVVYNHLGPEGNYLGNFGPYFTDRHHTPWGDAVNVDGPGSDEVRRFFLANATMWLRDYHVDALRLDAIHGIIDTSAMPFLAELSDAVAELRADLNRHAWIIAESDLNDPRVITSRDHVGGIGCDSQWSDDFHHALHVAVTGDRHGWFGDFDGLDDLAHAIQHGFVYDGRHSAFRGRRHGATSSGLPGERFVVYAQNHDQVGNRLLGDRLTTNLEPAQLRLLAGAVLLSPFVPMLFMGEEYGESAPFPYFVSHSDNELVAAVREGRRAEFAHAANTPQEAPDPVGESTFSAAVLDWGSRTRGPRGALLQWHRELLSVRRESPSIGRLRPAEVAVRVDRGRRLLVLDRRHAGDATRVVLAFGDAATPVDHPDLDLSGWQRILDSEDDKFGGSGGDPRTVAATSVTVFRRDVDPHGGTR